MERMPRRTSRLPLMALLGLVLALSVVLPAQAAQVPASTSFKIHPSSGPGGTVVTVTGTGWMPNTTVNFTFHDPIRHKTWAMGQVLTDGTGAFNTTVTVPLHPSQGDCQIRAKDRDAQMQKARTFTVT